MPEETKPTQPLLADILEEMRTGFAQLREEMQMGFARIETRLDAIEKEIKIMSRQIGNLEKQMARITAEHEEFDDRVTKLENPSGIQ
jgi:septal ring factor EnvC (AmiA/AmiB activator)